MSELSSGVVAAEENRVSKTKTLKVSILAFLSLGLISLTWFLVDISLYGSQPLSTWIWVAVTMMFWIAFSCYFFLVNNSRWLPAIVHVWSLAIYLVLLPKDIYVVAGGVIFFLLSIMFQKKVESEKKNQPNFSISRTINMSIILAFHGFLLLIGFNLYYNTSQDFKQNPSQFYQKIGSVAARSIPFVSENVTPGANLNQTLDEYLETRTQDNLPQDLKNAPPSVRKSFIEQYRRQFLSQFGISASGSETLGSVLAKVIDQKAKEVLGRYESFFPLIFTIIIVGLLRTFGFVFNWLTIFVTWLLFKILLTLRFFKLVKATVEVDKLEI